MSQCQPIRAMCLGEDLAAGQGEGGSHSGVPVTDNLTNLSRASWRQGGAVLGEAGAGGRQGGPGLAHHREAEARGSLRQAVRGQMTSYLESSG